MDPHTHCAAIIISTSDDPQARQLSGVVTNSSLIVDLLDLGEFNIKKITRIASDLLRWVLFRYLFDLYLTCYFGNVGAGQLSLLLRT